MIKNAPVPCYQLTSLVLIQTPLHYHCFLSSFEDRKPPTNLVKSLLRYMYHRNKNKKVKNDSKLQLCVVKQHTFLRHKNSSLQKLQCNNFTTRVKNIYVVSVCFLKIQSRPSVLN